MKKINEPRVSPAEILQKMPNSKPVSGVDGAWTWRIGPFRKYAFLDSGETSVFRMNAVDGDHLGLFADVVEFVRARQLPEVANPVVTIPEFASAGYDFDVLAVPQRVVYENDANEFPDLARISIAVFPAFTCEFSGSESVDDAVYRVTRALLIARLFREPNPFLRVKYRNPAFGGFTDGEGRHFMPYNALEREIRQLEGVADAIVEFENYQGVLWRVSWAEGYRFDGPTTRTMSLSEALDFAHSAAYGS